MLRIGSRVVYISVKGRKYDATVTKVYAGGEQYPTVDLTYKKEGGIPDVKTRIRPQMGGTDRLHVYTLE